MFLSEAYWIKEQLEKIPNDQLYPILNVGSSTLEARKNSLANLPKPQRFQLLKLKPLNIIFNAKIAGIK